MMKFLRKHVFAYAGDIRPYASALKSSLTLRNLDRISLLVLVLVGATALVIWRLFSLQVLDYRFYAALASDQHRVQRILQAQRGEIIMRDHGQGEAELPVVTNKDFYQIYAVPKQVKDPAETAKQLQGLVNAETEALLEKLSKPDDPYEPIERRVPEQRYLAITGKKLAGVYGVPETFRYYLEENIGSHVLGFVGMRQDQPAGFYGIEGYFDQVLAGSSGFFQTERDVAGRWIALSDKTVREAQDGADIVLTLDRTVQYMACKALNDGVKRYDAQGGALIIMEPYTGRILAMCSAPDFNPNYYSKVDEASVYNNTAIFETYEPGSIFKPVIMAAGVDLDRVQPYSTFIDKGEEKIDVFTIKNANEKIYGQQTMVGVLENSINTGMIHVARQIGQQAFADYVHRFGFGEITGIELETESAGNIASVDKKSEIFMATASFGQGITVTPLQMVQAYAAIVNGGNLMRPYIVDEIRYTDGRVEKRSPITVRRVISSRTSVLLNGMLTSVVKNGQAKRAQVPGYYVGGKTGTAQIAGSGGKYLEVGTNQSFVGFAPADEPRFVMLVKFDRPTAAVYADATTAPVFSEVASFLLNYYDIPPDY
ncbi:MAG: penicillin-binding protein 2 [Parcubacteria group bacterium]|nr:penicillin-binding protein 2 [Parcubacteria group bacterium]